MMSLDDFETPRLLVRKCSIDDAEQLAKLLDQQIGDRLGRWPYPQTEAQVRRRIRKHLSDCFKGKCSPFVIEDRSFHQVIGWFNVTWRQEPVFCAYFTHWLGRQYQGNGVATEVGIYAISQCFQSSFISCVKAATLPENQQVLGLLRAWGFRADANENLYLEGRGRAETCLTWRLDRREWNERVQEGSWPKAV